MEQLILSGLYDARQEAGLAPLQVDERLSVLARQVAMEEGLQELAKRAQGLPALPYGPSWSAAAIVPEAHAPAVAAKARALAEPGATHFGVAQVPIGGGRVVVSVVVAAPPGARVLSTGDNR